MKKWPHLSPKLKKKLAIFAVVGVVALTALGGLALYAGLAGYRYLQTLAASPAVQATGEALQTRVEALPALVRPDCLDTVQTLLNLERLVSTPLGDSFKSLQVACFDAPAAPPKSPAS